jgi:hypothetical protein
MRPGTYVERPWGKCSFRRFTARGQRGHMYGLSLRLLTAGLDKVRDASG